MVLEVADIVGSYKLTHVDGKRSKAASLRITADGKETAQIGLKVGNTLFGKATFHDDVLTATLASTMMLPPPELAKLEEQLSAGFASGFRVKKGKSSVTLFSGENRYTFALV